MFVYGIPETFLEYLVYLRYTNTCYTNRHLTQANLCESVLPYGKVHPVYVKTYKGVSFLVLTV